MEISQILVHLVMVIYILLVLLALYFYSSTKLRIFKFLGLGFFAMALASIIQIVVSGVDTGVYVSLLNAGAGLFFATGALTAA
jgi:NAD/NADP transhydrogenase beta subunit